MNQDKNYMSQAESPGYEREHQNNSFGSQPADHEQTSKSSILYAYGGPTLLKQLELKNNSTVAIFQDGIQL